MGSLSLIQNVMAWDELYRSKCHLLEKRLSGDSYPSFIICRALAVSSVVSNLSFWLFTQPSLWQHLSVSHDLKNDGLLPAPSPALQSHEGFGFYGKRME